MRIPQINPATRRSRKTTALLAATLFLSLTYISVQGFDIPEHVQMTKSVLAAIKVTINGRLRTFSERALEQIARENERVDYIRTGSAALFRPSRHFTNENFLDSSTRLIDHKNQIIEELTKSPPNGNNARILLGQALHTLQDFYSHSNWVELGNAGLNSALGRNKMADPPRSLQPCPATPSTLGPGGGGDLTSAYYVATNATDALTGCDIAALFIFGGPGKCFHGNYEMLFPYPCAGINKDIPTQVGYTSALRAALPATKDYLEQIINDPKIAGNEKALAALLDVKSIGFVVDDTGSMSEDIAGVRSTVSAIVRYLNDNPEQRPAEWVLERFGDPDIGPPFITDSAAALLSAVERLSADGGGDCPERSQAALAQAIDSISPGAQLYFFSDASAKDSALRNSVISRAQEKAINISYILTGSCSPVDEAYIRGARETGGQLFFINRSEVPFLFDLIQPQLTGDLVTLLSVQSEFAGKGAKTFTVPVDSSMTRLIFSISMDMKEKVAVRRPSGQLVLPTDPDTKITNLSSGCIVTINTPGTGDWQVEIAGQGNYSVIVKGNGTIDFNRFDFVKANEEIHGGYVAIDGQPLAKSEAIGEATLLGEVTKATFFAINEAGEKIQDLPLERNFPKAVRDRFLGKMLTPNIPFGIVAIGTDMKGQAFRRQYPVIYRPQTLGIEVSSAPTDTIKLGETVNYKFLVKNLGSAATFTINVSDKLKAIKTVTPTTINLAGGEATEIIVTARVPDDTPVGTRFDVTLTATRNDDSTLFNSATIGLTVVAAVVYEADVAARPNGDGTLTMADWVQAGRFFTRLDLPAAGSEFQRADCAPRATKGDGEITIADWVQAGRYAAGLDPVVAVGGPTSPVALPVMADSAPSEGATRQLRAVPAQWQRGQIGTVSLELNAQGNENALAFTLNFDPRAMAFVDASLGEGAQAASLSLNQAQAAHGRLGVALALSTGQSFGAGNRALLKLRFIPASAEGVTKTELSFDDQIFRREIVDAGATVLSATSFSKATIEVSGRSAAHVIAANYFGPDVAADAIASAFGVDLATTTVGSAGSLLTTLGGTRVAVKDARGVERLARLFFVSPNQVNYEIPAETAEGYATVTITDARGIATAGMIHVTAVAPGLFSADASGKGWAAANVVYVRSDQSQTTEPVTRFDAVQNRFVPVPIEVGRDMAILTLFGTGVRHRSNLANVKVKIGDLDAVVEYADRQGQFFGLDQINVRLPNALGGRGEVTVEVIVDGKSTNSVKVAIK